MGANTPVAMHPRPSLGYRDAPAAVRFLQEAFGFELLAIYDGPRDGTVAHAELRWPSGGSITLHTAASAENSVGGVSAWIAEQEGYPAFGIHLDTDDPDTAYARARAAGATIIRPLSDSPHGTRGFIARDPEGLFWSVGTPPPRGETPHEGP